jgi:hypothetical protein
MPFSSVSTALKGQFDQYMSAEWQPLKSGWARSSVGSMAPAGLKCGCGYENCPFLEREKRYHW